MKRGAVNWSALPCLAAVLAIVQAQAANPGYLRKTGPVPIRFHVVKPAATPLPPLPAAIEAPATTEQEPAPASEAVTSSEQRKPLAVESAVESFLKQNVETLLPKPAEPDAEAKGQQSANELLVISPQMLIEYFRSAPGATNGAGVSALVPVQFTPAIPAAHPSSRAIYKTE